MMTWGMWLWMIFGALVLVGAVTALVLGVTSDHPQLTARAALAVPGTDGALFSVGVCVPT